VSPTLAAQRSRPLTARDVMSAPVVTATPATSPWAAWSSMVTFGIRHLVVTVDDRCVGLLDDREVFAQWPMGPLALRRTRVGTMMRDRVAAVLPDTDLRAIARVMTEDRVDAVPVVDDRGALLGLVTAGDIVAAVAAHGVTSAEGPEGCG
jgi:CBS-domain-containing membrane protein